MNYEDKKQMLIVRQSQLKLTLDWANSCGYCLSLEELTRITERMVDYVYNGPTIEINEQMKAIDGYLKKSKEKTS
jgi:hypothetical protein